MSRSARIDDERSRTAITAWSERPWGTPWAGRDDVIADATTFNELTLWTQGMMPPEAVTLARDGSARGGEVWAPLDTGDFETLALAVAFLMATAPPPSPSPEDRGAAALAALPESDRRVFELHRQRDDGTWPSAKEIVAETGVSEHEVGETIRRVIRALVEGEPAPANGHGEHRPARGPDLWGGHRLRLHVGRAIGGRLTSPTGSSTRSPGGSIGDRSRLMATGARSCGRRVRWCHSWSNRLRNSSRSRSHARRGATGTWSRAAPARPASSSGGARRTRAATSRPKISRRAPFMT